MLSFSCKPVVGHFCEIFKIYLAVAVQITFDGRLCPYADMQIGKGNAVLHLPGIGICSVRMQPVAGESGKVAEVHNTVEVEVHNIYRIGVNVR